MGNYLADRRKNLGLTQKDVASFVGVSEGTVSRWESGEIANMKRDKINLYAKALKTTPSFIMTGETALRGSENTPSQDGARSISDEDIKFALFGGNGDITDAMYDEVRDFAEYVKQREARKNRE